MLSSVQAIVNHNAVNSFRITNGRTKGERITLVSSASKADIVIGLYNVSGQLDYYLPLDMKTLMSGVYVCKAVIAGLSYSAKISIR